MAIRAGLDQSQVVRAAAALADSGGYTEVTLANLATKPGVRTPTLYHYVAGLAGLRQELAMQGIRELSQQLGRADMGQSGNDAVMALAHAYRAFVNEHPGLYAATVPSAESFDKESATAQAVVVEIALRTLSAYHLSQEEAVHVVRMLRSLVHGFATLESESGFGLPLDRDVTFERLLRVFLDGLAGSTKKL